MQTILGSTGVIGNELAKALSVYTNKIRLVSRNPKQVNGNDELLPADLTDKEQTLNSVKGSEIVYLTVGLEYDINVWRSKWPIVMHNVIDACKKHNSKLVFFDNVYSYGKVNGWMKEQSPLNPSSEKGKVRKQISEMILEEIEKGNLKAIIARAADFYGPKAPSFVNVMIFENFKKGKRAMWLVNDKVKHSFTYTPDAGKATAILGNTEDAYNQIWHLPTDINALTGKEITELCAKDFGAESKYIVLPKWMLKIIGLFNKTIKENNEMLYQYDSDYLFDSTKFEKRFNFKPTSYTDGIKETMKFMKAN
ncbi:MAG: NAD-dependent epimerase/dehydratase family protein [Ignavibacteriaceae bacterium]